MLSGKKVSLKNVISKVYSGLNLKDESQYINIIEWLGEAISKIKTDIQLESVPAKLCIVNHKAELPCDMLYLESISICGQPMLKAFADNLPKQHTSELGLYNQYFSVDMRKFANKCFEVGQRYTYQGDNYFTIRNGFLNTSYQKGDIDIVYKRLPVDEEGFPLIPEEESYREALFWYAAWKYFFIQKIEASGNEFNKFNNLCGEAEQKWHWYCGQAGTESLMPDEFVLENIKRNFISLVPKIDSYINGYTENNK